MNVERLYRQLSQYQYFKVFFFRSLATGRLFTNIDRKLNDFCLYVLGGIA